MLKIACCNYEGISNIPIQRESNRYSQEINHADFCKCDGEMTEGAKYLGMYGGKKVSNAIIGPELLINKWTFVQKTSISPSTYLVIEHFHLIRKLKFLNQDHVTCLSQTCSLKALSPVWFGLAPTKNDFSN